MYSKKFLAYLLLVLIYLSGCDDISSLVNSGTQQSADTRLENSTERHKEMAIQQDHTLSLKLSIFPVLMSAIRELSFERFEDNLRDDTQIYLLKSFACYEAYGAISPHRTSAVQSLFSSFDVVQEYLSIALDPSQDDSKKKQAKADLKIILSSSSAFKPAILNDNSQLQLAVKNLESNRAKILGYSKEAILKNEFDIGKIIFTDFDQNTIPQDNNDAFSFLFYSHPFDLLTACAAHIVLDTTKPIMGWPRGEDGQQFMRHKLASSIVSSQFLLPIVAHLNHQPNSTQQAHEAQIQALFKTIVIDFLIEYQRLSKKPYYFARDMAGSQASVHFTTLNGYDFQGDTYGSFLTYLGVEWYGKGYLQGQLYTIEVAYKNTLSAKRKNVTIHRGTVQTSDSSDTRSGNAP